MAFKFEGLEVWQLAIEYTDSIYELAEKLPHSEDFNLKSQITRAATSIALNIAEGSTGLSDSEKNRLLGLAIRSLIETVACLRLIARRNYVSEEILSNIDPQAHNLAKKLHSLRKTLKRQKNSEVEATYLTEESLNNL